MKISHLLYKVDDVHNSVKIFQNLGFNVTLGRKNNPYNALIYFQDGSYIELIENMNLNLAISIILRLIGRRKFAEGLEIHDKMDEGFIRFSFHADDKNELNAVKKTCRDLKEKTSSVTVGRTDVFGNKLSCHCLFPFDHNLPFFITTLKGGDDLWKTEHSNKAVGIKSIQYKASAQQCEFIRKFEPEKKLHLCTGIGGITYMDFLYSDEQQQKVVFEDEWNLVVD